MENQDELVTVGRVVGLWRYPVKSMAGEALPHVDVGWQGLPGDRRWAFVKDGDPASGFPWLTLRDRPEMARYAPRLRDPGRPDASPTVVRTPAGGDIDVTDPALTAALWPAGARVIRDQRGIYDTFPLSLITTATVRSLGALVGRELDVRRFRPNLLVEAAGGAPFPEDAWVGCELAVGAARMRVDKRDGRCVVVTLDPDDGARDPRVLRRIAQDRGGCLGVYGTTVTPGRVAVGDSVMVTRVA